MPLIVFFPIIKYLALMLLMAWVVYVWAMLATSGDVVQAVADKAAEHTSVVFAQDKVYSFLMIYYALGFFWTFNWIIGITQTTIAGAIASYYWTRDKKVG